MNVTNDRLSEELNRIPMAAWVFYWIGLMIMCLCTNNYSERMISPASQPDLPAYVRSRHIAEVVR